jgi:branched-chain amino acid transport system substrate-binding protein
VDHIPVLSMGYGRADAADGKVFEWTFNFPDSYWSQASAFVRYIGAQEGGLDKLGSKKIALIYHNSPYGKEPIPALRALSTKLGFKLIEMPVDHPGQEQGATWLEVRRSNPDWILLWGWGVMNQVSIKQAASINYPMNHMMGVWWSGAEPDVIPAGAGAAGYRAGAFHAPGSGFPVHAELLKTIYKGNLDEAKKNNFGEVLYNRGMVNSVYVTEAIRTAMKHYGNRPLKGSEVRWGLENLNLTAARLKELGMHDMLQPIHVTCADHESGGALRIQQWDGKQWTFVSDWIEPMKDVIGPLVLQSAATFAKENNVTPRTCG